ncbi:MAG TPA: cyclopropane fatty acyl phospholipid synthase [Thermodesulfobacteriaceae bacterium]|nr:cyclopropane fatty acyl phospholipid synthase [Thermodesulfobacteriaceae bacterium]
MFSIRSSLLLKESTEPKNLFRSRVKDIFSSADIAIDGSNPWDIRVHDKRFFPKVFFMGSLGLGESYMDSWWDAEELIPLFDRIFKSGLADRVKPWSEILDIARAVLFNLQKPSRAFHIGEHHYNIGNDLYRAMLDRHMIYSCGYWKNASDLEEAQEAKMDLIAAKLHLEPGMKVLDIGCGWGGTARYLAKKYGVMVTGITVSSEQQQTAEESCRDLPVKILLQDYRSHQGLYDRILSVGMFEHVGYKNYRPFMKMVNRCLKQEGLFLLHTIGGNNSVRKIDPWIGRYIFPNSMLPSAKQITDSFEGLFVLEDWHNFGIDYWKTLQAWFRNFNENWITLKKKYDSRFYRMWKYYLLSCASAFKNRQIQLWQIVLSGKGVKGGYCSIR